MKPREVLGCGRLGSLIPVPLRSGLSSRPEAGEEIYLVSSCPAVNFKLITHMTCTHVHAHTPKMKMPYHRRSPVLVAHAPRQPTQLISPPGSPCSFPLLRSGAFPADSLRYQWLGRIPVVTTVVSLVFALMPPFRSFQECTSSNSSKI